jgi:hypothetical protein
MIKEETVITLANDGMHNQKAYRTMKDMLNTHSYISPRLYHVVFMGSELSKDYQDAMKALCFELRRQDIPCQWKACLEVDEEKGLHFHVFLLTEAKYKSPCSVLNHNSQQWMNVMMQKRLLTYHIAPPHHPMHRSRKGQLLNYATLAGEKLADCIVWISYLVKKRSKSDQMTHIYFGSRKNRENIEALRLRTV